VRPSPDGIALAFNIHGTGNSNSLGILVCYYRFAGWAAYLSGVVKPTLSSIATTSSVTVRLNVALTPDDWAGRLPCAGSGCVESLRIVADMFYESITGLNR
jgi:hypothetical protein